MYQLFVFHCIYMLYLAISTVLCFMLINYSYYSYIYIFNGRLDNDRSLGNYTFRQTSVIDYTIGTLDVLKLIGQFEMIETDPIFCDGHCILSHSFDSHNFVSAENDRLAGKSSRPKWDASRSEQFCENINLEQIEAISSLLGSNMPDHVRVNEATERITLFTNASTQTFPVQNKGNFCRKKPWHCADQRVPNIRWRKGVITHISRPVTDSFLQRQAETI